MLKKRSSILLIKYGMSRDENSRALHSEFQLKRGNDSETHN